MSPWERVQRDIDAERVRQKEMWGGFVHDSQHRLVDWSAILGKMLGDLCRRMIRPHESSTMHVRVRDVPQPDRDALYQQAIELAASAVALAEALSVPAPEASL